MPEPIRILQVFAKMNRGGAESMIMSLYRNINRSVVQFDFIVHTDEKCSYDDEIKSLGGHIYRMPRYTGINHKLYILAWHSFFQSHREYQIIHGHIRSTASIYLKIAKQNGLITIAHSHSTSNGKGINALVKNILQLPIRYTADYLFACSVESGRWLFGSRACKKANFKIIYNAIDTKAFQYNEKLRNEIRNELNIQDKFVVGTIGRLTTPKNPFGLISIFNELQKKEKNSVLVWVGEGELRKKIESKINELNLEDNVIMCGIRSDIPKVMQAFDVFLLPSLWEGLPLVTIEAQAAGLPVICSNNVSRDVKITDNVWFLPLTKSLENWTSEIIEKRNYIRNDNVDIVKNAGYDIKTTANEMMMFYLSL